MPVMSKPGFLAKTDSGLRRLLSEELWSWGKDKKSRDLVLSEPDMLQNIGTMQHTFPNSSSRCPDKRSTAKEMLKSEGGVCQYECLPPVTIGEGAEKDPLTEGETQKHSHVCLQEKHDSLENCADKVSSRDRNALSSSPSSPSSSSSSSSGCPLRVRSLPNSPDRSWRSQKSVGSFTSLPEFQRASSVCVNASVSSSDIDDDLPFDSVDSKSMASNFSTKKKYETKMGLGSEICIGFSEGKKDISGNPDACNVHNKGRLDTVSHINRNLGNSITEVAEQCYRCLTPQTCTEVDIQKELNCTGPILWSNEFSLFTDSHFSGPLSQDTGNRNTDICCDSSSGDDGPLETEEKSEVCSQSSEGLGSSEDEMVFSTELDNRDSNIILDITNELPDIEKSQLSNSKQSNFIPYKRKQLFLDIDPECSSSPLENQVFGQKPKINKPANIVSLKSLVCEEALSEILSPVDEVLSYGSAELPPSITWITGSDIDNRIFPLPIPASEIITWTSEDELPVHIETSTQHHPERSPTEDPSIVSEDLPSLSEDLLFSVKKEESDKTVDKSMVYKGFKDDILTKIPEASTLYQKIDLNNTENDFQDKMSLSFLTMSKPDEIKDSDPFSSFSVGDRVLVFHSKPGELKFKGTTSFACGYWAGVELDSPSGSHDGTFQGIEYFKCNKNCGVLVRPDDISHLTGEQESDLETRVGEDPFSDEEPFNVDIQEQDRSKAKYIRGIPDEKSKNQELSEDEYPASRMMNKHGSPVKEMNNNSCPAFSETSDRAVTIVSDQIQESTLGKNALPGLNGILKTDHLHHSIKHTRKTDLALSTSERKEVDHADLWLDEQQQNFVLPTDLIDQALSKQFSQGNLSQDVQHDDYILHTPVPKIAGLIIRCCDDLDSLVEKLTIELIKETVTDAQELRRRRRGRRILLQDDSNSLDLMLKKKEDNQTRVNQLGFSDQWHCAPSSSVSLKVQAHDPDIVHRLVEVAVEELCGHPVSHIVDIMDAPNHLINEESRKAYQQVIFDLTSEVFHEILKNYPKAFGILWNANHESLPSTLQTSNSSLRNIKTLVQREVRRVLNLERNDLQMKEMLQVLCKYERAQRDKVDYILIQELHKEELQWVDYRLDQLTVKIRMTEEIFNILLQDTISVLKQIYMAPPSVDPPALKPARSFQPM